MNARMIRLASVALACAASAASAQFSIPWHSIDGGGGRSTGGNFTLTGTIGQVDAFECTLLSANFQLAGGFMAGFAEPGCPADLTIDGQVDSGDLERFIQRFIVQDTSVADLTCDGQVDSGDLELFIQRFLGGC
jgi:hypothetical protein